MDVLPEYKVFSIPITQIWVDPEFNHRQRFTPESVETLTRSINDTRLECPVYIQPWTKNSGFTYRLLAGFRRLAACRLLHWTEIPAFIVDKDLSEFEAHKLNFLENLERKDLNILEEARGIRQLFPLGETPGVIGKELNRPRPWVHRRVGLLNFPHEVQLMFASGRLKQKDLDVLLPLRCDMEAVLIAAQRLLTAHSGSPDDINAIQRQLKRGRFVKDSRRTKAQISSMIAVLFQEGVDGLPTRVAAWCAGRITTEMLLNDIKKWRESL